MIYTAGHSRKPVIYDPARVSGGKTMQPAAGCFGEGGMDARGGIYTHVRLRVRLNVSRTSGKRNRVEGSMISIVGKSWIAAAVMSRMKH